MLLQRRQQEAVATARAVGHRAQLVLARQRVRRQRRHGDDVASDLQPDHEEEQRHQPVVDPVPQIQGQGPVADLDDKLGPPQGLIRRPPGRVPPHQGDGGGREQNQAAGGLGVQELPQGNGQAAGDRARPSAPGTLNGGMTSGHGMPPDRQASAVCRPGFPAHQSPLYPSPPAPSRSAIGGLRPAPRWRRLRGCDSVRQPDGLPVPDGARPPAGQPLAGELAADPGDRLLDPRQRPGRLHHGTQMLKGIQARAEAMVQDRNRRLLQNEHW